MMLVFTEVSAALVEVVLVYIYLNRFFSNINSSKYQFYTLLGYFLFFVINCFLSFFVSSSPMRMVLLTVFMICLAIAVQHAQFFSACCASIVFSAILVVVDLLSMEILYFFNLDTAQIMESIYQRSIYIVLAKIFHIITILLVTSLGKHKMFDLPFLLMIPLILGNVFTLFTCVQLWLSSFSMSIKNAILLTITLIGLLYINIILYVYLYYIKMGNEASKEKIVAKHQLELQLQYYETINKEQEQTRSMWHDIRKQLNTVATLVGSNQTEAVSCLKELDTQFSQIGHNVHFDNPVISSILNYGLLSAQNSNIKIDLDVLTSAELHISPMVLSVVIGNTLENAVHACQQITDSSLCPWIKVCIKQQGHLLYFSIENSYDPTAMSNKNKKYIHGYGLKNVINCVDANAGLYSIQHQRNVFTVQITLNV